jgi:uncharacterized protein YjiS (DUF1127 family)
MSAPITKNQFAFELPNLSYIDISFEEPELRFETKPAKARGFQALVAAFRAWREKRRAMAEMAVMTDRELSDIGVNRGDLERIFRDDFNQDLRSGGLA